MGTLAGVSFSGIFAGTGATCVGTTPVTFTSTETIWGTFGGREAHHAAVSVMINAAAADDHFHQGTPGTGIVTGGITSRPSARMARALACNAVASDRQFRHPARCASTPEPASSCASKSSHSSHVMALLPSPDILRQLHARAGNMAAHRDFFHVQDRRDF